MSNCENIQAWWNISHSSSGKRDTLEIKKRCALIEDFNKLVLNNYKIINSSLMSWNLASRTKKIFQECLLQQHAFTIWIWWSTFWPIFPKTRHLTIFMTIYEQAVMIITAIFFNVHYVTSPFRHFLCILAWYFGVLEGPLNHLRLTWIYFWYMSLNRLMG